MYVKKQCSTVYNEKIWTHPTDASVVKGKEEIARVKAEADAKLKELEQRAKELASLKETKRRSAELERKI